MHRTKLSPLIVPVVLLAGAVVLPADAQEEARAEPTPAAEPETSASSAMHDPMTPRVQQASGLYITGPFVRIHGARGIINLLRSARMDTAVIDLKDSQSRVHHDTAIEELEFEETGMLGDTRALIRALHDAGIHTVARIVCFNDDALAERELDRAILQLRAHQRGRHRAWTSWGTGTSWLDPWDLRNHDMIVELSREAEALGFDEIQLDYIRFPVDDGTPYAYYPDERSDVRRRDLLLGLLRRIDEAVHIPLGVDVFGIQAFWEGDTSGLGQDLELWAQHADVFTPMLYLNSMREWNMGQQNRAYRLVHEGVRRLRARLGQRPVIRPFLQAFEEESENWGPGFILNQIRASEHAGADGFLFWHPGSSYGMVQRAMQRGRSLAPFAIPEARTRAREAFGG